MNNEYFYVLVVSMISDSSPSAPTCLDRGHSSCSLAVAPPLARRNIKRKGVARDTVKRTQNKLRICFRIERCTVAVNLIVLTIMTKGTLYTLICDEMGVESSILKMS